MAFQLKNTFKCSESWENMTPSELGRFCGVCQKEVIDFTQFTKDEITDFFTYTKLPVCGPVSIEQLRTIYIPSDWQQQLSISPFWQRFLFVLIICFGSSLFSIQFSYAQDSTQTQIDSLMPSVTIDSIELTTSIDLDSNLVDSLPKTKRKIDKQESWISIYDYITSGSLISEEYEWPLDGLEVLSPPNFVLDTTNDLEKELTASQKSIKRKRNKPQPIPENQPSNDLILSQNPIADKKNRKRG